MLNYTGRVDSTVTILKSGLDGIINSIFKEKNFYIGIFFICSKITIGNYEIIIFLFLLLISNNMLAYHI